MMAKPRSLLFRSEVDLEEAAAAVMLGGFPADLAAKTGLIAGGLEVRETLEKIERERFEEMPILGATGKERAQREFVAAGLVDVEGGEVALAGSGDVEAEAELGRLE